MFINYSNHPSEFWARAQGEAALTYGNIVDVPFPNVPVEYTSQDIMDMAKQELGRIFDVLGECGDMKHAVMCQGEFTLTFAVVSLLQQHRSDVSVVSAVSDRVVSEKYVAGKTVKEAEYVFCGFREYTKGEY